MSDNYAQLTRMELGMPASVLHRDPGHYRPPGLRPSPLTAIHLARQLGSHTRIVDRDGSALSAATSLLQALDIDTATAFGQTPATTSLSSPRWPEPPRRKSTGYSAI